MSLDKAIEHGKEHRKKWQDVNYAKSVDTRCRNHGGCDWCEGNRKHKYEVQKQKADYSLKEDY